MLYDTDELEESLLERLCSLGMLSREGERSMIRAVQLNNLILLGISRTDRIQNARVRELCEVKTEGG